MTSPAERIIELLTKAGATRIKLGWNDYFGISLVDFDWKGELRTKYGMNMADLLTRCECWLASLPQTNSRRARRYGS